MSTSIRRALVPGVAALALALAGCSAANEQAAEETSTSSLSGTLSAGGASSQEAAQTAWRAGFQQANPDVQVDYDPIGSGGGREQFIGGGYPFAGTDSYLSEEDEEVSGAEERCGGDYVEVPNYVSPIAVIFNVEGVDELNLSPETVAGIFNDEITTWDDPAIAEDNPDADLPSENITAVHRSDESGTTGNFTNYLGTVAESDWPHGEVESWPIEAGEGANGTSGVVSAVQNGTNAIGYADASQAGDLGTADIGVGEEFVSPTPEAAAQILEVSPPRRGTRRGRPGLRPRLRDRGVGHLPDRADLLPGRLLQLRRRRGGRAGQGLPRVRPERGGPAGRGRERRFGAAVAGPDRAGPGHRRGHLDRTSDTARRGPDGT